MSLASAFDYLNCSCHVCAQLIFTCRGVRFICLACDNRSEQAYDRSLHNHAIHSLLSSISSQTSRFQNAGDVVCVVALADEDLEFSLSVAIAIREREVRWSS